MFEHLEQVRTLGTCSLVLEHLGGCARLVALLRNERLFAKGFAKGFPYAMEKSKHLPCFRSADTHHVALTAHAVVQQQMVKMNSLKLVDN